MPTNTCFPHASIRYIVSPARPFQRLCSSAVTTAFRRQLPPAITHLSSMHAVRQKFRPKHQALILKCYPRFQKNVQEVKANSSELSYLLYYASTRRSKLQKVGEFLEKKTTHDVHRARLGYDGAKHRPSLFDCADPARIAMSKLLSRSSQLLSRKRLAIYLSMLATC